MINEEDYEKLVEFYGLELILEQNDLTEEEVIRILHLNGLIDLDNYFYDELEQEEDE